jgi:hypothetical protein
MIFCVALAVALCLASLPWIIIGCVAQRSLARWLHWRLNLLVWLVFLFVGAYLLYTGNQHDALRQMVTHELLAYVATGKHYQLDIQHWPFHALWAETWPVWLQTWPAFGLAGFASEIFTDIRTDILRTLRQDELRHERKAQRQQQKAKKRTAQPKRLPDNTGGMMVMGVPIKDEEE